MIMLEHRQHVRATRRDVTAVILDRPRHADIIRECREAGVRIRLISDGDVGAAIEVAKEGSWSRIAGKTAL